MENNHNFHMRAPVCDANLHFSISGNTSYLRNIAILSFSYKMLIMDMVWVPLAIFLHMDIRMCALSKCVWARTHYREDIHTSIHANTHHPTPTCGKSMEIQNDVSALYRTHILVCAPNFRLRQPLIVHIGMMPSIMNKLYVWCGIGMLCSVQMARNDDNEYE